MRRKLKKKYWTMLVAAGAAISCGAVAYATGFTLPAAPKIAFLYFDQKNDGGWTQAFDEARPKIEIAVGMKIPFVEKVPEVAGQIKPAAEQFIQRGYNIIIGTAFGYSDTFKELSEKYPKVAFLNASGTPVEVTSSATETDTIDPGSGTITTTFSLTYSFVTTVVPTPYTPPPQCVSPKTLSRAMLTDLTCL